MGIENNKSSISKNTTSRNDGVKPNKNKQHNSKQEDKKTNQKFISRDVKNYFSYNLKSNFDRASSSKNTVTYDLKSFDEDK